MTVVTEAEKAYQLGKQYEQLYRGCGQCVIAALQDTFGLTDENVFRVATGFAGGGGLCGDGICGAYAGSIMMLGYLVGRPRNDFEDTEQITFKNFELVQRLRQQFIGEFGSVICRDIQYRIFGRPYFLLDADDVAKFEQGGGHDDKCPEVVGKAARWTADIIVAEGLAGR